SVTASAYLVLSSLVNTFGATVVAAFGVAGRLDAVAFLPAQSVSLAVIPLVGQNLGAGREDRAKEVVRTAALMSGSIAATMTLLVWLEGDRLMRIFTDDAAVVAEGARYLRIVGLAFVTMSLYMVASGALQGAADTLPPMLFGVLTLCVVRVPLAWYLAYPLGLGSTGIWWSMAIGYTLGMICNWTYYSTDLWRRKVVARRAALET
ncbi:MAG TPA: MATE family efflux transporter, partial [Limnochorda sp.]